MNKKQKITIITGIILVTLLLIYWYTQGAEIFTKSQVLVDKTTDFDRMLGVENKQYIDKFIFGLVPSGFLSISELASVFTFSIVVVFISGIIIYLFRNKRKETL